jgi:hypothetical protein
VRMRFGKPFPGGLFRLDSFGISQHNQSLQATPGCALGLVVAQVPGAPEFVR